MPAWAPPPLPPRWAAREAGPALVGRRRELQVLEQAWDATLRGCRQVLFVGGDPGAGKSRLAAEVARTLHGQGAAVLAGACLADLGGAYEPFVAPLEVLRTGLGGDGGALGVDPARATILLDRLAPLLGRGRDARPGDGPAYAREVFDAVVEVVLAAAGRVPLVLVLEDLHLAGPATLQLLRHLVEHSAGSRLLVLGTLRTTAADRSDRLVEAISSLYALDGVRRLDLAGLETDAVVDYLLHEGVPDRPARSGAVLLRDATGGNPFFLREVWRDLSARGGLAVLTTGGFRVPRTVLDVMQDRLAGLGAPQRLLVEVAAVLGDTVDVATVARTAGVGPEEVLVATDAAVAVGLLGAAAGGDEPLQFVHHLARQAVLDLVPASRLARHHADAVSVLEQVPRDDLVVQRLAHHCAAARDLGLAGRAVEYLVLAAGIAEAGLAHRESAALLERAASLCTEPARRDDLRLAAARSLVRGADSARARVIYEELATSGTSGVRLSAAVGFEHAGWVTGTSGSRAAELIADRLRLLPADPDDPAWVRATASLGRALAYSGDPEGDRLRDEALACARRLGDAELLGDVLAAGLGHDLGPTRAGERVREAEELSALAERSGSLDRLAPAAFNRAVLAYLLGDLPGIERAAADMGRAARVTGQPAWAYYCSVITFGRQVARGELPAARRTCEELRSLGRSVGMDDADGPYGTHMFMVQRETGALEAVRGLVSGQESPEERWGAGLLGLYTELGLAGPTARLLSWVMDDSLGPAVEARRRTARWPGVLALLAEAVLWLRDRESAERLRPELQRFSGLALVLGAFDGPFGSADRYLAALDSLLGQGNPADLFDAALDLDTRMDAAVHQAHGLALHVVHRRRAGSGAAATEELARRAADLARPRGLVRVQRLLAGATGSTRSGRDDGLTARELEVLALLGQGCSNRAIATRLHISENTTANHVRSILLKTGSENRTQAAMYGRERR